MGMRAAGWLCGCCLSVWAMPASAAVCTFSTASGDWNNPSNWSGCSTGNGTPTGTPGIGDTAIINGIAAGVVLPEAVSVSALEINASLLGGPGALNVGTLTATNAQFAGVDPGINPLPVPLLVGGGTVSGSLQLTQRQLRLTGPGILAVDGSAVLAATTAQQQPCPNVPGVTNNGDLCIDAGGTLAFTGAAGTTALAGITVINNGLLRVDSGRTATFDSLPMSASAVVRLNGGTLDAAGDYEIYQGMLTGSGTVDGQLAMFGGTVDPGDASAGTLQVIGPVTLGVSTRAVFDIYDQVGGHDQISATQNIFIQGVVETRSVLPSATASFTLISSTTNVDGPPALSNVFPLSHQLSEVGNSYVLELLSGIDICTFNGGAAPFGVPGSWSNCSGATPDAGDSVLIDGASAVAQISGPLTVGRVQLRNGGTLELTNVSSALTVDHYFDLVEGQAIGLGTLTIGSAAQARIGGGSGARQLGATLINDGAVVFRAPFSTAINASITNNGSLSFIGVPFDEANQTLAGTGSLINAGDFTVLQGSEMRVDIAYTQSSGSSLNLDGGGVLRLAANGSFDGTVGTGTATLLEFTGSAWIQEPTGEIEINGICKLSSDVELQGTFSTQQLEIESGSNLVLSTSTFSAGVVTAFLNATIDVQVATAFDRLITLGANITGPAQLDITTEWVIDPEIQPTTISGIVNTPVLAVVLQRSNADLAVAAAGSLTINGNFLFDQQNPLDPQGAAGLSIDPTGALLLNGVLRVTDEARLELNGAPQFGAGSALILESLSTVTIDGGTGLLDLGQAVLRGSGNLVGSLYNGAGVVSPGITSPGALTISGGYEQEGSGRIDFEIDNPVRGGPNNDRLQIGGAATLGGVVNIIPLGGFDPPGGLTYSFMDYASVSGAFDTTNLPPQLDDTHQMVLTPTAYEMQPDGGGGGPFDCTWSAVSPGLWDNPANWSCAEIPGPGDTARVLSASADVQLNGARSIATLQFTNGRIGGSGTLDISTGLSWDGGAFEGGNPFTDAVTLAGSATSTFAAGGSRVLRRMRMTNNGTVNWTGGNLQLQTSDTEFDNLGTLNFNIGVGAVSVFSDGAPNVIFHHLSGATALNKNGAGDVTFETGVDFLNGAPTMVNAGRLILRGDGTDIGQYFIVDSATLELQPMAGETRSMVAPGAISGDGDAILKVAGPGTVEVGASVYSGTPLTRVAVGELKFLGAQTLSRTELLGGTLSSVDPSLEFATSFDWQGGQLQGPPGSTATLNGSATASLSGGLKSLNQRRLLLNGPTSWTSGNLQIGNSGEFLVNSGQTLTVNNATPIQIQASGGGLFSLFGNLVKNGGAALRFDNVAPDGTGGFDINTGVLDLGAHVGPSFPGATITAPGVLRLSSVSPRSFGAAVGFAGSGEINLGSGSDTTFNGSFAATLRLTLDTSSAARLDTSSSPTTLAHIGVNAGASLLGSADLVVDDLAWTGGTIGGSPARSLTINGLTSSLSGSPHVLDGRRLSIHGSLTWLSGNFDLRNGAVLDIGSSGVFSAAPFDSAPRFLSCTTLCASMPINNNGIFRLDGIGTGYHRVEASAPLANGPTGLVEVRAGRLDIDSALTNAGAVLLYTGATLGRSAPGTIDLGTGSLAGSGQIAASLFASSPAFIDPLDPLGGAVATLNINGDLSHSSGGVLRIDVNGTAAGQFDQLQVTGNVMPGPVAPAGTGLTTGQSVPFIMHATRSGNYTSLTGPNAADYVLVNALTSETRLEAMAAGPLTCTWDHTAAAPDTWENAAHWSCGAVPGPADTAIFDNPEDAATLTQNITVGTLDLRAGSITGDFHLDIATSLLWTGGSMVASNTLTRTRIQATATGTFSGAQKTMTRRELTLEGDTTWTTGLLELRDGARLRIATGVDLTTLPGPADEFVIGTGITDGELINEGSIVKQGANVSGIDFHVAYSGIGAVDVQGGSFRMKGPGIYGGSFQVAAGAVLEFSEADRNFPVTASITGSGTLRFGDAGAIHSTNTVSGTFAPTGSAIVNVENGELLIDNSGISLPRLRLLHPGARVGGDFDFTVNTLFEWQTGTLAAATAGRQLTIAATATADLSAVQNRTLDVRELVNQGTVNFGGGALTFANGAILQNESLLVANVALDTTLLTGGVGTPELRTTVGATTRKLGAGRLIVGSALRFPNAGTVEIQQGDLHLLRSDTDAGDYTVGCPACKLLVGSAAVRQFQGTLSGSGQLFVSGSTALAEVRGAFSLALLVLNSGGSVDLDTPAASVNIPGAFIDGGVLSGADDVQFGNLDWLGGRIVGSNAQTATVTANLQIQSAGTHVLDGRRLRSSGSGVWSAGNLELRNAAIFENAAGATLSQTATADHTLTCGIGCGGTEVLNAGTLDKTGTARLTIGNTVRLSNSGLLDVNNGTLELADFLAQPGNIMDVRSSGTLQMTAGQTLLIDQGVLRGNGTIIADQVTLSAPAELRPNAGGAAAGIGVFTIGGDFNHAGGGVLEIDLNGTTAGQFDLLQVLGTVTPGPVRPAGSGLGPSEGVAFIQHSTRATPYTTLVGAQAPDYILDNTQGNETRLVDVALAGFTVDREDDPLSPLPADEACTTAASDCTLRGAIKSANLQAGPSVIDFAISGPPGQVHAIVLLSALPQIARPILIDGTTQDGFVPNSSPTGGLTLSPKVVIDGSMLSLSGPDSIAFDVQGGSLTLRGLSLVDFERTLVAGNGTQLQVFESFVGLRADGTSDSSCVRGMEIGSALAQIGGADVRERNVIAGCDVGIDIIGSDAFVQVQNNLIGTDVSGLATIAGQRAIRVASSCGPMAPAIDIGAPGGLGNVIGGQDIGVLIEAPFGLDAGGSSCAQPPLLRFAGNSIGIEGAGNAVALPNRVGVQWSHASAQPPNAVVQIGLPADSTHSNRVYNSLESGIVADPGVTGLAIGVNAFNGNQGLAIDLRPNLSPSEENVPTENDPADADVGPNLLQNFARISAASNGSGIDLTFNVDSNPANSSYGTGGLRVDFYLNNNGQSDNWLGSSSWTSADFSSGSRSVTFPGSLPAGAEVLSIVTDAAGNSSELGFVRTGLSVLSSTPDPADIGTDRTITGQILAADGEPFRPTGTVTASDGVDSCGTAVLTPGTPGQTLFSCTMPTSGAPGPRSISINYVPDDRAFLGSSSVIASTVQVGVVATTTNIVSINPQPSQPGQPITVTMSVSAATGVPTGTVAVMGVKPFNLDACTATLSPAGPNTASGSCVITPSTPGLRSFFATYPGDGAFGVSGSANVSQVVRGTATFGSVQQSAAVTAVGEVFTVDIVLTGNGATPLGTITVTPLPLGTAQTCSLVQLPQSSDSGCAVSMVSPVALGKVLLVNYGGSADLVYPATQTFLTHDTTRAPTTASITADSPDPSETKQLVTVQFQVQTGISGAVSSVAPLSGSVTVSDGLDSCTGALTAVTSGQTTAGSCQLTLRAAGTRQLIATYQGNENFAMAVSPPEGHLVNGMAGADLSVTVRNSVQVVNAGSEVEYVIDVLNSGTSVAGSSRVINALPAQMPSATWVCVPTAPSQCPPAGSGSIDQLVDLTGGGRVTFRLRGVVNGPEGEIVDTASVTPATGVTDPDPNNNSATDRDQIGIFAGGFEDAANE